MSFNGDWWITGGFDVQTGKYDKETINVPQISTEMIPSTYDLRNKFATKKGPNLPTQLGAHCLVYIGKELFFMAGGILSTAKISVANAYIQVYIYWFVVF
jgi:hypothetical protein